MNWPLFRAVASLALLALLIAGGSAFLAEKGNRGVVRVSKVEIHGELERVTAEQIRARVAGLAEEGLLRIDVGELAGHLEQIDWIDTASVRRVWPDGVAVHVVEQQPLALWGDDAWLNQRAEVFVAPRPSPGSSDYARFSVFHAPLGLEQKLAEEYRRFAPHLARLDLTLVAIKMDARRAVSLLLTHSMPDQAAASFEVRLGRIDHEKRFARFVHAYQAAIDPIVGRLKHIDLRYPHGFAVAWKPAPNVLSPIGEPSARNGLRPAPKYRLKQSQIS